MNVLFIALEMINDIHNRSLYTDVIRAFVKHGDRVTVVTAREERLRQAESRTYYSCESVDYVLAATGNITRNKNFIDKGIATVLAGMQYTHAFKKAHIKKKYDLVVCATPSITFEPLVRYVQKRDGAKVVLLLKDMWPYDLVFDNILTTTGIKGLIYRYFDYIAKKLYREADVIGCMSPKNIDFLVTATADSNLLKKTRLIPNSIDPLPVQLPIGKREIRKKWDIPQDKTVFVYGGNLGVAQGMDFVIEAIKKGSETPNSYFIIAGGGTDADKVAQAFAQADNVRYVGALPRDDFEELVYGCDVGLVFLTWNCHTPNFPSRILPLMQASLPVICCVDDTTDVGVIAQENGFGLSCPSNCVEQFVASVQKLMNQKMREEMGQVSRDYLEKQYSAEETYRLITQ